MINEEINEIAEHFKRRSKPWPIKQSKVM